MKGIWINGRLVSDDGEDLNEVDISVPETALIPVQTDWCDVQIPAKDLIATMTILCGDGTTIMIYSVTPFDDSESP